MLALMRNGIVFLWESVLTDGRWVNYTYLVKFRSSKNPSSKGSWRVKSRALVAPRKERNPPRHSFAVVEIPCGEPHSTQNHHRGAVVVKVQVILFTAHGNSFEI